MRFLWIWLGALVAAWLAAGIAIGAHSLIQFVLLQYGDLPAFVLVVSMIATYLAFWAFVLTRPRKARHD